jgi:lysophospholipase L1-like esterase
MVSLLWIYALGLHGVLLWRLARGDRGRRLWSRLGWVKTAAAAELTETYYARVGHHALSLDRIPPQPLVLIGDSITQGLEAQRLHPNALNYGINGDTTLGVKQRIPLYAGVLKRSRAVVLAIGINDLRFRSNQELLTNYWAILTHLPPVPVLVSSILPVDEAAMDRLHALRGYNQRIQAINQALQHRLAGQAGRLFVDHTASLDENGDGHLDRQFHCGDGLHLSAKGYDRWIQNLRQHLQELLAMADL